LLPLQLVLRGFHIFLGVVIRDTAIFAARFQKKQVRLKRSIQQLITGLLLLLLVLGNTPRLWLHDLFARHTGCMVAGQDTKGKDCMQPDRQHCRPVDLVIESPFIPSVHALLQAPAVVYATEQSAGFSFILSGYSCRSGLRGPPAAAC